MKKELKEKALILRKKGKSIRDIAKTLKVSKGSVSLWVRDIKLTETQKNLLQSRSAVNNYRLGVEANAARCKELREQYQKEGVLKAKAEDPLHLIGCMLYWAEGAKSGNCLRFANSDPDMVKLFLKFLTECYKIDISKISMRVYCHSDDPKEIKRIENFWKKELNLPSSCVKKSVVNNVSKYSKGKRRKNKLPYGVCRLNVFNVKIIQSIYVSLQEYGKFKKPEWLLLK